MQLRKVRPRFRSGGNTAPRRPCISQQLVQFAVECRTIGGWSSGVGGEWFVRRSAAGSAIVAAEVSTGSVSDRVDLDAPGSFGLTRPLTRMVLTPAAANRDRGYSTLKLRPISP